MSINIMFVELFRDILKDGNHEISEKYNIPIEELISIWENVLKTRTNKDIKKEEEKNGCIHLNTRGSNIGKVCGKSISRNSITKKYCIHHLSQENKNKIKLEDENSEKKSNVKIVIKKDSYGWYTHKETGLVFKHCLETNHKIAYAYKNIDKLEKLDTDHIELCKKFHFKYDETLFDTVNI